MKILVTNDARGRFTIPEPMRKEMNLQPYSILSFTLQSDGTILVKPEKICDNCRAKNGVPLSDVVMCYPESERDKAFMKLSSDFAKRMGGAKNE